MDSRPLPTTPTQPDIPNTDSGCVVWHCRNLRITDHPAIEYATENYESVLPIFIFDPSFYVDGGLACDARIQFLHESVDDLAEQYASRDGQLTVGHGDPVGVLSNFVDAGWDIVTTADPTGRYGWKRDNDAAEACDVTFIDADGLTRGETNSRENWSERVEQWFTAEQCEWDRDSVTLRCIEAPVTTTRVAAEYSISPSKDVSRCGGTSAARAVLNDFSDSLSAYPGNISAPQDARTGTSQLSPYLRFGCLSVRQVYQTIESECADGRAKNMFVSRLFWNKHYNQKLVDWPGWMDEAVNPVLQEFHSDTYDSELVEAWKHGQTGYPMVDASMRCLKATGWLNFRMRAMCASFLCDLLQQPWKIGADWFYYHLLDADPAINYTQFQIQAGVDGTNMMRVYNPRKQVRDTDPEGDFIRSWVPELRELPSKFLDKPEKTPVHVQDQCEVSIGEDYPYPVVEYEAARQEILAKCANVKPKAKRALQNEEVARRVSMAQGGKIEDNDSAYSGSPELSSSTEQTSLTSF